MTKLDEFQMKNIKAGGANIAVWAIIVGILSFSAGLLDGYTRPFKCR